MTVNKLSSGAINRPVKPPVKEKPKKEMTHKAFCKALNKNV